MPLKLAFACLNRRHDALGTFARRVSAGDAGPSFLSAVFDKIPLTALALKQGGCDWGSLAYAVGFGGSMIWLGSSVGVAISSIFSEAQSATAWVRAGWFVIIAYLTGLAVILLVIGWHPEPKERPKHGQREWLAERVTPVEAKKAPWQLA